jgi:signal transduction histidine kinase/predicted RNA-binding protein with RPS1 domain/ActR/RegA family two-component response regulator
LSPSGLIVELYDGRVGRIRPREISWDPDSRQSWRERFTVGQTLEARVVPTSGGAQPELSLRLVERDPWRDLEARYPLGQTVVGIVTGIESYGAFVELEPGVTGLLHFSRLPSDLPVQAIDVFWPGDHVHVVIESVDPARRRISVSVAEASERRAGTNPPPGPSTPRNGGAARDRHEIERFTNPERPWSVLVVDDDTSQCRVIAHWFERAGHVVRSAHTAADAMDLMAEFEPDVLLTDLGLPVTDGIELAQRVRAQRPEIKLIVMADTVSADERATDLESMQAAGLEVVLKPVWPEDLIAALYEHRQVAVPSEATALVPAGPQVTADLTSVLHAGGDAIAHLLARVQQLTRADNVVLFAVDPARRRVEVVGASGRQQLRTRVLPDLIHSPVRDVAEDGQVVRIADIDGAGDRARHLAPVLSFEACLGLPVEAEVSTRYALFLFFTDARQMTRLAEDYGRATAIALGALLERAHFASLAADLQRLAFLGQINQTLVHEINHSLTPLAFGIDDAKLRLADLATVDAASPAEVARCLADLRFKLDDLSDAMYKLTETARLFALVAMKREDQLIRIDEAMSDVVRMVDRVARRNRVAITFQAPPSLTFTRSHASHLQQILINILVNAVQQIALLRPREGGHVRVSIERVRGDDGARLRIRINDDGPGIHWRLWERIFDLGFTTRREQESEGSGLGLYVARVLAGRLGGRVFVAESFVLSGSEFVVELPFSM